MKPLALLFLLFLIWSPKTGFTQKTGIIRFAIEVDNGYFEIFLNDTLLEKRYKDTLPVGHYEGTVWSPTYKTKDISFDILEGDNGRFYTKLEHNEAYYEDIKASVEYDRKRKLFKHLPVFLIVAGTITSGISLPFLRSSQTELNEQLLLYGNLTYPFKIRNYKTNFVKVENRYNNRRAVFYSGIGVSCVALATAIFSFRYFNTHFSYSKLTEKSPWSEKFSLNFSSNTVGINFSL